MDMGEWTSTKIGEMMAESTLAAKEKLLEKQESAIPSTLVNQNLGHNSKLEGLGANAKQKR